MPMSARVMVAQAQAEADETFKAHHPDAVIEHLNEETMPALSRS